jgi:hypothetical protein
LKISVISKLTTLGKLKLVSRLRNLWRKPHLPLDGPENPVRDIET